MNSYNENLQASIVSSLATQELQEKAIKSDANASMFTLYYAEGATITANDNLDAAKENQNFTEQVKQQAVYNGNICTNLLTSATQANQYIQQSVTNAATCAANVQIAANSILKLAGDMGNIYNIIHAANAKTELDTLAADALKYMSTTALKAEEASKLAMDVSIKTAEVTSAVVLTKAQNTANAMDNVLQIATNNFNTATQNVTTASATLAQAYSLEKTAEGVFKDKSIDYVSTKSAYILTNEKLNQDLEAHAKNQNTFSFSFDLLTSPFDPNHKEENYPVENYYVFIVPDTDKTAFAMANAENILRTQPNRFIPVSYLTNTSDVNHVTSNGITTYPLLTKKDEGKKLKMDFNYSQSNITDVNGKAIAAGTNYVLFMMAVYYPDYKRAVNCYDDFLSAPSWPFAMTTQLTAVSHEDITIKRIDSKDESKQHTHESVEELYTINFHVSENSTLSQNVEYRCLLLPQSTFETSDMLNTASFEAFEQEVENLEKIADEYDPQIASLQAQIIQATANMAVIETPESGSKKQSKTAKNGKKQPLKISDSSLTPSEDVESLQKKLDGIVKQKDDAIKAIKTSAKSKIDFIFNKTIAEQVLAGNYTVAKPAILLANTAPSGKSSAKKDQQENGFPTTYWTAPVIAATTDNFGNPLIEGDTYLAVVLSISTATEENLDMFTNAWSGYAHAPSFTFKSHASH